MASVFARILAAIRGAAIPSLSGQPPAQPGTQVRRANARGRPSAQTTPDQPADRAVRIADFRIKRLRQIAAFYADGGHHAVLMVGDCTFLPDQEFHAAAEAIAKATNEPGSALMGTENAVRKCTLRRRLSDLTDRERAILRTIDMLCEVGEFDRATGLRARLPIIWNEGRCQTAAPGFETVTRRNILKSGLEILFGADAQAPPEFFEDLRRAWRNALSLDSGLTEQEHQVLESYQYVEQSWLAPKELGFEQPSPAALSLGVFAGGDRDLIYDLPHHLVTFAPAGSDKRHAQIARSLGRLTAGAVALDIDGKAFHATARWRQKQVGKIFAFAPGLPAQSMHYNPLDAIGTDPTTAWNEARLLADLLTGVRGEDAEARDFIAPAIYDVALNSKPERRHMRSVVARVTCSGQQLEAWIAALARSPRPPLVRHAAALNTLPIAKREALARRIEAGLAVWQSPPIAGLTDRSDWTPGDLRRRGTLYLCVNRGDLDRYAPVLRTIVGQTIAMLTREKAMSPGSTVTFFLDELARLGPMEAIERAVDTGADAGTRLWMFFANSAAMSAVYPNAESMIISCAAHCYVEPDDSAAQELALRIGTAKSLFGTEERLMLDPAVLAGPDFADKVIVLMRGQSPANLTLPPEGPVAPRPMR